MPSYHYKLTIDNLGTELKNHQSKIICLLMAQGYEEFETFMITSVTNYIGGHAEDEPIKKFLENSPDIPLRDKIKRRKGKDNNDILSLLRRISILFAEYESKNYFEMNAGHWFAVISKVRHLIVHSGQEHTQEFSDFLHDNRANHYSEIYDKYFNKRVMNGQLRVALDSSKATDIFSVLLSFAHFIFLCLSEIDKLPTKLKPFAYQY